jgi:hypothetical protein
VLFGDSHAFHWFEPINMAAKTSGWQLRSWTKSACPSADVSIDYEGFYRLCDEWREATLRRLTGPERPHLVILSNNTREIYRVVDRSTGRQLEAAEKERIWSEGFRRTIERLLASGLQVAVIRNTPHADERLRACLASGKPNCKISREHALRGSNADERVARSLGDRITYLDFTDRICGSQHCDAVQNGVIVFRDAHHLTASYAATHAGGMTEFLAGVAKQLVVFPGMAESLPGDVHTSQTKP